VFARGACMLRWRAALTAGFPIGLGTYRFVLAALVLDSHATGPLIKNTWPLNPGIWAVAGFFVLSGFVMRRHAETLSPEQFYLDRFLRIYPQFLLFFSLSFVVVYGVLLSPANNLSPTPNWPALIANLLIFPIALNNSRAFGATSALVNSGALMPQAWSLGVEASYYLLLPFIARLSRLRNALFWISLGIFILSVFNFIPRSAGYYYLSGTLWMFLLGWRLHDFNAVTIRWLGLLGLLIIALMLVPSLRQTPTIEVASGALVAAWMIVRLAGVPANRSDTLIGAMSYSLFLCHTIPLYLWGDWPMRYLVVFAASLPLAWFGAHIEMRIADFRRLIRARRNVVLGPKAPAPA
jgi:peptidoglycan/LPS O-acetylase OafA/YrhL